MSGENKQADFGFIGRQLTGLVNEMRATRTQHARFDSRLRALETTVPQGSAP